MPELPYIKTITELQLIARINGREYVARKSTTDEDTPEGMREAFSWLSNERAIGEFVRVESRKKIVQTSPWLPVL